MSFNPVIGILVLIVVVVAWFLVHYWLNPHIENPDGKARITGSCKDTMEVRLVFRDGKVAKTSHWTDGCAHSYNCVYAAVTLATGKTAEEVADIDADDICEFVGGLPSDHLHCAKLAVDTLHAALDDYLKKSALSSSCVGCTLQARGGYQIRNKQVGGAAKGGAGS